MLILPRSNVSAPLEVILTAVRTAPRVTEPPVIQTNSPEFSPQTPDAVHMFPDKFVMTMLPLTDAAAVELYKPKPVVKVADETDDAPNLAPPPTYPDVVYVVDPVPNCTRILDAALKLTVFSITVTRFTQLGKLVKSIAVPDVDACAGANMLTAFVAVAA